jgi:hypothetical protein
VRRDGYELLIETPAGGLSHGMRSLIGRYTQLFNRRYGRAGRLFEGRFRSVLVQKEAYLRDLARHIAWSPVREDLARRPEGWRWSSFAATAREGTTPGWLESDGQQGAAYRRFVASGSGAPSPLESVVKSAYLGDARFVRKAKALLASGAYRKKVRRRSACPATSASVRSGQPWRASGEYRRRVCGGMEENRKSLEFILRAT